MTVSVEVVASAAVVGGGVRDVVVRQAVVRITAIVSAVGGRVGGYIVNVLVGSAADALDTVIGSMVVG